MKGLDDDQATGLFYRAFVYGFHIHCRLEAYYSAIVQSGAMQGLRYVVQAGSFVFGRFLAVLWAMGGFPGIPAAVSPKYDGPDKGYPPWGPFREVHDGSVI